MLLMSKPASPPRGGLYTSNPPGRTPGTSPGTLPSGAASPPGATSSANAATAVVTSPGNGSGISGSLGLLRSRDTGNSPSRERLANPTLVGSSSSNTVSSLASTMFGNNTGGMRLGSSHGYTPTTTGTSRLMGGGGTSANTMLRSSVDAVLHGGLYSRGNDDHLVPAIPAHLLLVHSATATPPATTGGDPVGRGAAPATNATSPGTGGNASAAAQHLLNSTNASLDSNGSSIGMSSNASSFAGSPVKVVAGATKATGSQPLAPGVANSLHSMALTVVKPHVTVVFDLDETLCSNRRPGKAILRPCGVEILKTLQTLSNDPSVNCFVEVILWTASMKCVAVPVVDRLDPNGTIFHHLIYRDRRWYKEVGYTKDLTKLGRDMNRCIIIENSPESVRLNRKNSILVKDFLGSNPQDQDLFATRDVLEQWIRECGKAPCASKQVSLYTFLQHHPQVNDRNEIVTMPRGGNGGGPQGRTFLLSAAGSPIVNPRSPLHVPPSRGPSSIPSRGGFGAIKRY